MTNYIEIKIPIKSVPVKLWNKVEIDNNWDKEYQTTVSGKISMMVNADEVEEKPYNNGKYWDNNACDKSFKNETILDGFKKFTNSDEICFLYRFRGKADGKGKEKILIKDAEINEWFYIGNPIQLTKYLRDANKLFVKDGYGKLTSQNALEFLQSIIESRYIKATIKLTQVEFENILELKNQLKEINLQNQSLKQELEEVNSELLAIKKTELNQLIEETKSKIDKSLWGYLKILLLSSDKNDISEEARQNLNDFINGNDLQKLLLLQHKVNQMGSSQQARVEVLPPYYSN
jgi:hypothetical protein